MEMPGVGRKELSFRNRIILEYHNGQLGAIRGVRGLTSGLRRIGGGQVCTAMLLRGASIASRVKRRIRALVSQPGVGPNFTRVRSECCSLIWLPAKRLASKLVSRAPRPAPTISLLPFVAFRNGVGWCRFQTRKRPRIARENHFEFDNVPHGVPE